MFCRKIWTFPVGFWLYRWDDLQIALLLKHFFVQDTSINTMRPIQNSAIFQTTFWNEWTCMNCDNYFTEFCFWGQFNNIPALVQIITWRRPDIKPLSETMMVPLLTHIYVTRSQSANTKCFNIVLNIDFWKRIYSSITSMSCWIQN